MKPGFRALAYLCPLLLSIGAVTHAASADVPEKKAAKAEMRAAVSAELSRAMGDVAWGIGREELQKRLTSKVEDRYRFRLAKARDASERERLRHAADDEVARIKSSHVEFDGTSTPWDTSFLRGEFTHGNDESMLASRDDTSQTFYFFIAGKLWKMYTVFDVLVFPEANFAAFASSLQQRFGPANQASPGEISPSTGRRWIEWQDSKTTLRTADQTNFYGFYFLILEDRGTVSKLAGLRAHTREVD
jgi:hypothetical protein